MKTGKKTENCDNEKKTTMETPIQFDSSLQAVTQQHQLITPT